MKSGQEENRVRQSGLAAQIGSYASQLGRMGFVPDLLKNPQKSRPCVSEERTGKAEDASGGTGNGESSPRLFDFNALGLCGQ